MTSCERWDQMWAYLTRNKRRDQVWRCDQMWQLRQIYLVTITNMKGNKFTRLKCPRRYSWMIHRHHWKVMCRLQREDRETFPLAPCTAFCPLTSCSGTRSWPRNNNIRYDINIEVDIRMIKCIITWASWYYYLVKWSAYFPWSGWSAYFPWCRPSNFQYTSPLCDANMAPRPSA